MVIHRSHSVVIKLLTFG